MHLKWFALASLLATAAQAKPPAFEWPAPDVIESAEVPGVLIGHGVPLHLKAVRVKHRIDEMIDLYGAAFRKAGFYIPPHAHQVDIFRDPALTALDPTRFISYTVIFQDNHDGTTTLVLGEANLALSPPSAPGAAPTPPLAESVLSSHSEGSDLVSFEVRSPAKDVKSFYDQYFAARKYTVVSSDPDQIEYRKDDEEILVRFRPGESGQPLRVLLVRQLRPVN